MFDSTSSLTSTSTATGSHLSDLKKRLRGNLVQGINWSVLRTLDEDALKRELRNGAEELCRSHPGLLSTSDRQRLAEELVNEAIGFGPLEPLLRDTAVSDILINGPDQVFVERKGRLEMVSDVRFDSNDHLLHIVQRIAERAGRRIDESSPMVDARLPDGSRFNAVIPPLALDGALVSIRRFASRPLTMESLVTSGSATVGMMEFLAHCVKSRLNIIIAGGTGSGKTTLLNVLSSCIPTEERVVTIEDAAELQLQRKHLARMETRPPNIENAGEISIRQLLRNALRMRPDRIVIGECRGDETFDMLQAMNTGHSGSLTTIHANSARDAISRLEMLVATAGLEIPAWTVARQIASAVHLIVHVGRLGDGTRKILQIAEVTGTHDNVPVLNNCFTFQQMSADERGHIQGQFCSAAQAPECLQQYTTKAALSTKWKELCRDTISNP